MKISGAFGLLSLFIACCGHPALARANEHKAWGLTPLLGVIQQHLASFKEYPVRQVGLGANVGKTIEGIQSQLLRVQTHD
jgi:hypothetical protein